MKVLALLSVLCLILSVQAEQRFQVDNNDGVTVIKISSQNEEPAGFAPFSFLGHESPLHRLFNRVTSRDSGSMLERLFHFPTFENENEQPVFTVQIMEQDDNAEPFNLAQVMSGMFQHMQQMLQEMRTPTVMTMEPQDDRIRAGCPLLRVCAADIDSFCSVARLSQTVAAIEHCLTAHRQKLSDECGAALDARAGTQPESSAPDTPTPIVPAPIPVPSTESSAESTLPAESSESTVPAVPTVPVALVAPVAPVTPPVSNDQRSNIAKADRFMAKLPASCRAPAKKCDPTPLSASPVVNTMVCLFNNRKNLPADCLQRIGTTPLFNCAVDVVKYCPHVRGQAKVIECLSHNELSTACLSSLRNHKAADPQFGDLATKSSKFDMKTEAAAATTASPLSRVSPIALGFGLMALVVIIVAVTVMVRRRSQRNSPVVVQLTNPVDLRQTL